MWEMVKLEKVGMQSIDKVPQEVKVEKLKQEVYSLANQISALEEKLVKKNEALVSLSRVVNSSSFK